MIFSVDISTSTLGYTILDDDGKIVKLSHLDLKKVSGFFDCVDKFSELCDEIKKEYNITSIAVEEPKKNFAFGKTSVNTIVLLLRFNGVCCYVLRQKFGIEPVMISEGHARKVCELKFSNLVGPNGKKISRKEQAFDQMITRPEFDKWPWDLKRTGKFKDYHYDEMDSYVIGFSFFKEQ